MASETHPEQVADNLVVNMTYILTVDGEVVDSTAEGEFLQFIQGYGSIIPGLEKALYGLKVGENRKITVPAHEAYGEYDFEQVANIPVSEFPAEIPLDVGLELEMKDKDGDILFGTILAVGKTRVKVDFNHPLAGKDLDFDITILALRTPTAMELEQGFVE